MSISDLIGLSVRISKELRKRVKIAAASRGISVQEFVALALERALAEERKKS